jgi:hypothetical protein
MNISYGVVWHESGLPVASGKLELLPRAVRFEGAAESRPTSREIAYENLSGVRIGRSEADRIDGRPSLVLERRSGQPITIASVAQSGVVAEIAERLAALQLGPGARRRTAFVVPLKDGSHDAARALLDGGPPFDPEETALDRHEVFLTPDEVVFIFDSRIGADALEPLLSNPELWQSASAWREHLAGPPRIAEDIYSWTRPDSGVEHSLLPPGLRNGGGSRHF